MSLTDEFFSLAPRYRTKGTLLKMVGNLEKTLDYAINIIENYEMDIRNMKSYFKGDLNKTGFCQGSIYRDAVKDIKKMAGIK